MHTYIYGADSETYHGLPITLQFYSEDHETDYIIFVDEHTAAREFFGFLDTLPRHATHVIYCHNLKFDLVSFVYQMHSQLDSEFSFEYGRWHIEGCYGAPTFCRIRKRSDRDARTIYIVDSFLWYQGSLAAASNLFCPELPKLKRPKGLGDTIYSSRDDNFVAYAMRDAEVAYHIGKAVQAMHDQYDIPQSVSLAHMSATIFRRHYLTYTIPQPPNDRIIEAALLSYHGGKNNLVTGAAPAWHTGVTALDISSAYPYAMMELPAFSDASLYKRYPTTKKNITEVPPFGVYKISGYLKECEWPCIFDHSFQPLAGAVRDIWVQGIELNEALRSRELSITKIRGYYYDDEKDHQAPALRGFVRDFYAKKQSESDKAWRHMYKITLNALYGKFIQTRKKKLGLYVEIDPETDEPTTLELRTQATAGGMYHPFIATAITAHTRAYMHQVEHKYEAIHTATDGIYTKQFRPVTMMRGRPRMGLGSLQVEGKGTLMLLRNKCYILYGNKESDGFPSKAFADRYIIKFAKHGFMGSVYDMERLVSTGRRKYTVMRAKTLKTALKRGEQVNDFVEQDYVLKVGPLEVK